MGWGADLTPSRMNILCPRYLGEETAQVERESNVKVESITADAGGKREEILHLRNNVVSKKDLQ